MKDYTLSRKEYDDFVRVLQLSVGSYFSGILQHPRVGKEDRIEVKTKAGKKACVSGYYNKKNVRVKIEEEDETTSRLLEKYIKGETIKLGYQ